MNFPDIPEWIAKSDLIVKIPVLLFAITIHEYSHGKAAYSLGDPTAKLAGRLTLNPLSHLDPVGAIALFLFNFGWAKPVPVNSRYFHNPRRDNILMAISGPISNLAAAFLAGIFIRYFLLPWELYLRVLVYMVLMNLGLGLFNLIPIPPLDGSHVLENILPSHAALKYGALRRYGPLLLFGVIFLDRFTHSGILGTILLAPMIWTAHLFAGDNLFRILHYLQ
jgi:Zn-dependent protease